MIVSIKEFNNRLDADTFKSIIQNVNRNLENPIIIDAPIFLDGGKIKLRIIHHPEQISYIFRTLKILNYE